MKSRVPLANGWQWARDASVPVAARTCAKNSPERRCRHSERRFSSDQAGRGSRYVPGSGRSPYQPMPTPSPWVTVFASAAVSDCAISDRDGRSTWSDRKVGAPR
jgi:hypothetical protein